MRFNPYPNKQPSETNFSKKSNAEDYLPVELDNSTVQMSESQKRLGIILDNPLSFH